MSQYCIARIITAALLFFLITPVEAQVPLSREYKIKAVFLFNFTQFMEWPANAFADPQSPFIIGILGTDPFQSMLDETVAGEQVKGRSIIIERYPTIQDIKQCHILYVTENEETKIREVVAALKNKNTLTVGDQLNFTTFGGIVRFLTLENKIKIEINVAAAKAADINISSKLLRLAEIFESR